jgi:hypothetical protein
VPHRMVWPNYLTFAKLVYCFFVLTGSNPMPGQSISVGDLMLMGAHAMRASNVILALLSFSRGFLANTRGSSNPTAIVFLTRRRLLLMMAFYDARVLHCSTAAPLLRMHLPSDDAFESRDTRSIFAARLLAYSDACTGENRSFPSIGGYIPGYRWFGARYASLQYMRVKGELVETPINVLELLALIITATLTIQTHLKQYGSARGCHFHVFCDNIAAVAKARTHRSDHPIYSYLLYLLSYILVLTSRLHNWIQLSSRDSQYNNGCSQPLLRGASRSLDLPSVSTKPSEVSAVTAMYQRYKPDIIELQLLRVQSTTAKTYETGANHLDRLLAEQGVTMLDLLNSPPCDIHYTAACFVTYLSHLKKRNGEPIDSKSINSYVSHVVYRLVNTNIINSPDKFRCLSTPRLVAAIKRRDGHVHQPLRETISISLSLPLINKCIILCYS